VVHPICFTAAHAAGQKVGLTGDFLILLEKSNAPLPCLSPTIEQLITLGSSKPETLVPLRLKAGEAKTTLAFLSFSSGTTGKSMLCFMPSDYRKLYHASSNRKTQGTSVKQCRACISDIFYLGCGYISLWSYRECDPNG